MGNIHKEHDATITVKSITHLKWAVHGVEQSLHASAMMLETVTLTFGGLKCVWLRCVTLESIQVNSVLASLQMIQTVTTMIQHTNHIQRKNISKTKSSIVIILFQLIILMLTLLVKQFKEQHVILPVKMDT